MNDYYGYYPYDEDAYGFWYEGYDPFGQYPYDLVAMVEMVVIDFVIRNSPPPPPRPIHPSTFVGWSQPPRPADVAVSFDPRASKRDQARSVLYDYYHDDPLRYWSDNEAVKRCFIGGKDPRKEDHDPLLLIAAYENPNHRVWQCQYSDTQNHNVGTGMHWRDMDKAVQRAIAHRRKLGPLPKSSYDTNPIVIYYYDSDKMKRITYPLSAVPQALDPHNNRWWAPAIAGDKSDAGKAAGLDDVHTLETQDPSKIAVERQNPGWTTRAKKEELKKAKYPHMSHMGNGSAGDWDDEGFTWDKDVAGTGVVGSITGAILALVSAVLDATGIGAVVGVPLGIATPFIVAAINATDTALHAGDFGAALANLGPALAQAAISAAGKGAGAAGFNIPPAALKALSGTVSTIANDVARGQEKKLEFGEIWAEVAKKAQSYGKIGDDEVEAIAHMLGGPGGKGSPAGHVFIQGYLAGKFLDMPALKGIAKILQGWAVFGDPRVINIALLGMGIGYLTQHQQDGTQVTSGGFPSFEDREARDSVGQIFLRTDPRDDLAAFVNLYLKSRYGLSASGSGTHFTGFTCPEGYEPIVADHQIGCAYRKKAACLAGFTSERGTFVCTEWDLPSCPPGMVSSPSGPRNWCYPADTHATQGVPFYVGEEVTPDYGPLARGCPQGQWFDPFSQACRPITPLPAPLPPHPMPHATGFEGFDYSQTFFPA